MGKPCIVGCPELKINYDNSTCTANGITIKGGETISIDGSAGTVFIGAGSNSRTKSDKRL